ncbi:MAG TPA: ABC transporter permease [Bryobacteraceae bacterium]|nr:ABC transporter permease [Bryobacteraceae bacterium]
MWKDVIYATRRLLGKPGFLTIALVTLPLGVGFNAAIFTFVNGFLIRPLPIDDPSRVVTLNFGRNQSGPQVSYPDYLDIRDRNQIFSSLAAMRVMPMALSLTGQSERVWGYLVSGNYFELLGITPWRGRFLTLQDDGDAPTPVAVISYACWQRQFAGDPEITGRSVKINGEKFTIIGVAPPGFLGTERFFASDIWVPFSVIHTIEGRDWRTSRNNHNAWSIGRLKPRIPIAQAEASLAVLASQMASEHPDVSEGFTIRLSPPGLLGNGLRRSVIGMAAALLIVAGLTLLVACTNLSSLVLAHAADRKKEIAIRLAIGADRKSIVRMMLSETIILGLAGGVLGTLSAAWLSDAIQAWIPSADLPLAKFSADWRVVAFGVGVALLTTVISGLAPSLRSAGVDVLPAFKNETATGMMRGWHLRDIYLGIQVAVCMVLLAGAVMTVKTLKEATKMRFGFDAEHAVTLRFDLAMQQFTPAQGREFHRRLIEKIRAIPGTEAAALSSSIPFSVDQSSTTFTIEGQPVPSPSHLPSAVKYQSGPQYFRAMGTRLIAGRDFDERDREGAPRVIIVNQTLADKFLPGENPLGHRIRFGTGGEWRQIVGVVEAGKYQTIAEDPQPAVWTSLEQEYTSTTSVVIRTRLREEEALTGARMAVAGLNPDLPIFEAKPVRELLDFPMAPLRFSTGALTAMAGLAALLCALGLYGLLAYSAVQRTREIGIRVALGAKATNVLGLLLKRTMVLVAVSAAVGIALSVFAMQLLGQVLYGKPDASIYAAVVGLLASISVAACLIPARRVLRIDPSDALRHE